MQLSFKGESFILHRSSAYRNFRDVLENQTINREKRSRQEQILTLLSAAAAIGIFPFVILRVLSEQWPNAIFNIFLVLLFAVNGLYIYKTRKVKGPRLVFALVLVSANIVGFYLLGIKQMPWSYPALVAIFFVVRPKTAAIFCLICITWLASIAYSQMVVFAFVTYVVTLLFTCIFVFIFAKITREQHETLTKLSRRDPLTDILNRRAFDHKLGEVIGLVREHQHTCLVLFDIDHFKHTNDTFGHSLGDRVLVELAVVVSKRVRRSDRFYRIGGEEFAIVLHSVRENEAFKIAENIRSLVEETLFAGEHKLTISTGITEYQENESQQEWFDRCDAALYSAKNNGRNQSLVA